MTDPDPRTYADDGEDAINEGQSAEAPAEGADDTPAQQTGSPQG